MLPRALRVLGFVTLLVSCAHAGPTNAPAVTAPKTVEPPPPVEIARSTFAMPHNKTEGRDPFHPNSSYAYETTTQKPGGKSAGARDLVLKVIGGTTSRRLCTINNLTLGTGEEGEATTPNGKVMIHVVKILDESVVITANGEEQELKFRRQF